MSTKKTIIFMGGSGTGKGTQAEILKEKIEKSGEEVLSIGIGDCVRELFLTKSITANSALRLVEQGQLFPDFLAIYLWGDKMNQNYTPEKFLFLDGIPRNIPQMQILEDALKFYGIKNPLVIYLKADIEILKNRMLDRGREDDNEEQILNRLGWFEKEVGPILDYYQKNDYYDYREVDGERGIDEIATELEQMIFN